MRPQRYFVLTLIIGLSLAHTAANVRVSMNNMQTADEPMQRTDRNSMIAHQELLEKARKGRIDIYFEGDSITRRWGTSDDEVQTVPGKLAPEFLRLECCQLRLGRRHDAKHTVAARRRRAWTNVNPKIIVVLAGTNNVGNKSPARQNDAEKKAADIPRGSGRFSTSAVAKLPTP